MSRLVAVRRGLLGMGNFIPLQQAEKFVARGMARFTSDAKRKIVFVDSHQKQSAEREARARETVAGYENVHRSLTEEELSAVPILRPSKLLRRRMKGKTAH